MAVSVETVPPGDQSAPGVRRPAQSSRLIHSDYAPVEGWHGSCLGRGLNSGRHELEAAMEQVPAWLASAVTAAGVAMVYVADDWIQMEKANDDDGLPAPELPH